MFCGTMSQRNKGYSLHKGQAEKAALSLRPPQGERAASIMQIFSIKTSKGCVWQLHVTHVRNLGDSF